jgi:hypothetical protein
MRGEMLFQPGQQTAPKLSYVERDGILGAAVLEQQIRQGPQSRYERVEGRASGSGVAVSKKIVVYGRQNRA